MKLSCLFILLIMIAGCKKTDTGSSGSNNDAQAAVGINGTTKCDTTTASGPLCYEYTGLPEAGVSVAKASCDDSKGTFTPKAACSRVNNVGGCTQGGSGLGSTLGKLVIYVYSPSYTADKVKQLCANEKEQYVQP